MIYQQIPLEIDYKKAGFSQSVDAYMTTYTFPSSKEMPMAERRPALVICAGGGYGFLSDREKEPIAMRFAALGFQTFILEYQVKTLPFPSQLLQAAKAVATIKERAEEWNVNPDAVFIIGFSAGGHLAASLGTLWNKPYVTDVLGYHHGEHRPCGMILSYPVITSGEFANRGSFVNLLLDNPSDELLAETSLENQVSADTPPAFIWHTYTDAGVPVENSMFFAAALRQHNIPFELHIFPEGRHGLSVSEDLTGGGPAECAVWPDMAARWAKQIIAKNA